MSQVLLSIIIPVLNEAENIAGLLTALPPGVETVVVDGGSEDQSVNIARKYADQVLVSGKGRARQMNAGAAVATGELLVFLHADSQLPGSFMTDLAEFQLSDNCWGRFNVRINGPGFLFNIISTLMNVRSCLTGICTGDQAMFVKRQAFDQVGGFSGIPLMEDIDLSRRLKQHSRPFCIKNKVLTSPRRWLEHGVWRTIWLMWGLRLRYFFGACPTRLVDLYYKT